MIYADTHEGDIFVVKNEDNTITCLDCLIKQQTYTIPTLARLKLHLDEHIREGHLVSSRTLTKVILEIEQEEHKLVRSLD